MLFGLAAKNAILIVEFAVTLREEGRSVVKAATEAARLRLRPILMTALAFILGVLPLALASGASALPSFDRDHGIGMIASTFLGLGPHPLRAGGVDPRADLRRDPVPRAPDPGRTRRPGLIPANLALRSPGTG